MVAIAVLFAGSFVVAQSCQQAQVRVTQEAAIATATGEVDFEPDRTQIRLVRQGLGSEPFWAVSLSTRGEAPGALADIVTVRVDANSGEVAEVTEERIDEPPPGGDEP